VVTGHSRSPPLTGPLLFQDLAVILLSTEADAIFRPFTKPENGEEGIFVHARGFHFREVYNDNIYKGENLLEEMKLREQRNLSISDTEIEVTISKKHTLNTLFT